MPKLNKDRPPKFIDAVPQTTSDFAGRMRPISQGVAYGDDPQRAAERAMQVWKGLDPIQTAIRPLTPAARAEYSVALGRAADIAEAAGKKRARLQAVRAFRGGVLLERAGVELGASSQSGTGARENLEAALDVMEGGRSRPRGMEGKFGTLSAKAMILHLEAREAAARPMEAWRRQGTEAIQQASLGGLIKESVAVLGEAYALYDQEGSRGKRGGLSGKITEAVRFTYGLMGIYNDEGTLARSYPRFAYHREDQPLTVGMPRRNFDVAVVHDNRPPDLVQVKTSHTSKYAEEIDVWFPQIDVLARGSEIIGWFTTMVDNERPDSEIAKAWNNLTQSFGTIPGEVAA